MGSVSNFWAQVQWPVHDMCWKPGLFELVIDVIQSTIIEVKTGSTSATVTTVANKWTFNGNSHMTFYILYNNEQTKQHSLTDKRFMDATYQRS